VIPVSNLFRLHYYLEFSILPFLCSFNFVLEFVLSNNILRIIALASTKLVRFFLYFVHKKGLAFLLIFESGVIVICLERNA
jgi:hypothetical protein